jgi:hypothetical protein
VSSFLRREIINTLKNDSVFLKQWGMTDYSLLLGVEKVDKKFSKDNFVSRKIGQMRNS